MRFAVLFPVCAALVLGSASAQNEHDPAADFRR